MDGEEVKNEDTKKEVVVDNGEDKKETSVGRRARKTISPYDIIPNNNPGSLVTQVQLKGENYDEWARSLIIALRARKKFGFVDGTIEKPDDDSPDLEDLWTNNSLLVSWMMNTIEPSLRSNMSHKDVAYDLWMDIKERFSVVNGPRIQQLKAELADCKQKGSTIEELANYEQIPTCKCGKCTCNIGAVLEKKREEERVHQFLMGLDDTTYGTVRSNLLTQDPLPALNRVYFVLVQEERVRTISRGKEENSEIGGESDHAVLDKEPKRGKAGMTSGGRRRGGPIKANVMQTTGGSIAENNNGFNNEQWEALLNLMSNVKTWATEKLTGPHVEDADWSG